ncbi:MAG: nucleoside phosphorylase [Bacteroidetes bacterium]|jgi:uridine phosphorylase|nr:nucleoside phosphorylase [Bacteroidota bacterium]MBK9525267.1 nucleoside phosphorylase [Bacteroidota bacterium]MBL0256074.1 nucleoside phosphorylase [Bacteroidota bacterium]MBP6402019.1 nucleoside phosphorylase [Bacteroidia bacterium]MBP6648686.1 nucleoside phosphorylase [Bacteroidia bacterium]
MSKIPESELILNPDFSVYHLNLLPEDISDTVINVGDPDRVALVSKFFDKIETKKQKREFVTHTGMYKGKRITVISTGIGTDNIDIVYNELDALVNINLRERTIKEKLSSLNLIRIGTSGSLQEEIPVDGFVFSSFGMGLDGLLNFYKLMNDAEEQDIVVAFRKHYPNHGILPQSYIARCSEKLENALSEGMFKGITASCSGFYAPQGRILRYELARPDFIPTLNSFKHGNHRITNFEMETGAMYGLAKILGHHCCSINAIVANRINNKHTHKGEETMNNLIETVLDRLAKMG